MGRQSVLRPGQMSQMGLRGPHLCLEQLHLLADFLGWGTEALPSEAHLS